MPSKTEAFKIAIDLALDAIKDLLKRNTSLEEIAEDFSPQMDDIIKQYQKQGLSYSAGRFQIRYIDEKSFAVSCILYFKDNDEKWHKATSLSPKMDASYLTSEAWAYLKANREKSFDIAAPEESNTETKE